MNSDNIGQLAAALSQAQNEFMAAALDGINPHFKSRYASLSAIWNAIRLPLADNGLAITQTTYDVDGQVFLRTTLMHESGEWIDSVYPIRPTQDTPQGFGSAITYARRYTLSAMVGVVADEDDDGNQASQGQRNGREREGVQYEGVPFRATPKAAATWAAKVYPDVYEDADHAAKSFHSFRQDCQLSGRELAEAWMRHAESLQADLDAALEEQPLFDE